MPATILTLGLIKNDPLGPPLLAIAYLIPLIVYSYNYYEELEHDRLIVPERAAYMDKKARVYPYLISGYVALLSVLVVLYEQHPGSPGRQRRRDRYGPGRPIG